MGNIEKSDGVTFYYRTLPDGNEEPCGERLDLQQAPSHVIAEKIQTPRDISLTLIFSENPPFSYTPEDLGESPNREIVLRDIAQAAPAWCKSIIIMEKGSKKASHRPK